MLLKSVRWIVLSATFGQLFYLFFCARCGPYGGNFDHYEINI